MYVMMMGKGASLRGRWCGAVSLFLLVMAIIMKSMDLFGTALKSYFDGNTRSSLTLRYDDGELQTIPVHVFFRDADQMYIDSVAVGLCRGRVLDVGAGTGGTSLFLQGRGFDVTAIDISFDCCEIMRKRGVEKVIQGDVHTFDPDEKFDTVLILGRSIGAVSDMNGFVNFLQKTKLHLSEAGQIVFNSVDEPSEDQWRSRRMRFEYEEKVGEVVNWFDIGRSLLSRTAEENGYRCEIKVEEGDGNYLAVLERAG